MMIYDDIVASWHDDNDSVTVGSGSSVWTIGAYR